jgi:hypothetical protein
MRLIGSKNSMCERSEKCAGEKWNADTGTTL